MSYGPSRRQKKSSSEHRHTPLAPKRKKKKAHTSSFADFLNETPITKPERPPPSPSKAQRPHQVITSGRKINQKGWSNHKEAEFQFKVQKEEIQDDISLHKFERNFYNPSAECLEMSDEKVSEWKKQHHITIKLGYSQYMNGGRRSAHSGGNKMNLPNPAFSFNDMEWPKADDILSNLQESFQTPTPIQSATWPLLLCGLNVIGIAKTGSGKTLAFLLPAIVHMRAQPKCTAPKVMVVLPTRELALQVEEEIEKFAIGVKHCCIYGGQSEKRQLDKIRRGVEIVVATPGRLFDFIGRRLINLGKVWCGHSFCCNFCTKVLEVFQ